MVPVLPMLLPLLKLLLNPDSTLGEISFREFTAWFKHELLDDVVQRKVDESTKDIKKDVDANKTSITSANDKIKTLEAKVDTLTANLKEVVEENKRLKKTGENNLKYLVNLDRNTRRSNVILFGLSETEDLKLSEDPVNLKFSGVLRDLND